MPKMNMQASKTLIEIPAGRYVARFAGTEEREAFKDSKFGASDAPRMGWLFEVVEGVEKGKKISQESGTAAVPRSTAARMLAGLLGRQVTIGESVDTDTLIGRVYSVKVAVNPDSDKGNLYIADLEPQQGAAPTSHAPAPAANGAPKPPARKSAAPQSKRFWFAPSDAAEPTLMTFNEAQKAIVDGSLNPALVEVCPEGESEYRPAVQFGFKDTIPF